MPSHPPKAPRHPLARAFRWRTVSPVCARGSRISHGCSCSGPPDGHLPLRSLAGPAPPCSLDSSHRSVLRAPLGHALLSLPRCPEPRQRLASPCAAFAMLRLCARHPPPPTQTVSARPAPSGAGARQVLAAKHDGAAPGDRGRPRGAEPSLNF